MHSPDYTWRVETGIDRDVLRRMLDLYRPFRAEINFSNGFSTREFADEVSYPDPTPIASLHYFEPLVSINASTRILDIGCNLAYYGHHFVKRGVHSFVGVDFDPRLFECATLLRSLAGLKREKLVLLQGDFGALSTQHAVAQYGPYDIVLFLGSANNIPSLSAALIALSRLLYPGGILVVEYLAIETKEPILRFYRDGFRGDATHLWTFSEAFLDDFLATSRMLKVERLLEWENRELLGQHKKILSLYRLAE